VSKISKDKTPRAKKGKGTALRCGGGGRGRSEEGGERVYLRRGEQLAA